MTTSAEYEELPGDEWFPKVGAENLEEGEMNHTLPEEGEDARPEGD